MYSYPKYNNGFSLYELKRARYYFTLSINSYIQLLGGQLIIEIPINAEFILD